VSDSLKTLQSIAKSTDNPVIQWAAAEIARLRQENETLRDHWPTFWKPLPVAVKEVGRD